MPAGSTLGAPKASIIVKATGALEKMFSHDAGTDVYGTLVLHHWDRATGVRLLPEPGEFIIHPHLQEHLFELSGDVAVREQIFILNGAPRGEHHDVVDEPAAYYAVTLKNEGNVPRSISTYASLRLHGGYTSPVETSYDASLHAFLARDCGKSSISRLAACSMAPRSYEVTDSVARASAEPFAGPLANHADGRFDDAIGIFHLEHDLQPGAHANFWFTLTFSTDERAAPVRRVFASLPSAEDALSTTAQHYHTVLARAVVMTPDTEVNRGALWAKANILRTQQHAEQGWCFVNDPTNSNNSVARDTAWFTLGADLMTPHFARDALLWYVEHLRKDGMVVEYFDIRNGKSEDYGLSVNDDTPLILIALWHHYCATGDREFLERVYPNALRAARFLLSQRDDRGLVFCRADGSGNRGIAGWRNVIKGYHLAGATTELNSESYAALVTMEKIARELGHSDDVDEFRSEAHALRAAINEHLLDRNRNLYYLTIGEDGERRTDVTCDLVFPVLFGVAEHDVATNIIATLSRPEFWTEAGMHTVPRNDIQYGPAHGYGLLGGVWGGPTFWFAAAAAKYNPSFMAYALSASFRHYAEDPRRNNTVPGQFCEWLHGEALMNQGMMLSPWFPPKYLWAAIEGAGGLELTAVTPHLEPHLPGGWPWIAVRNVCVRGKAASWFAVRRGEITTFASYPFAGVAPERCYEEDVSDRIHATGDHATHIVLRRGRCLAIMLGNTLDRTITTAVTVPGDLLPPRGRVRWYSSLVDDWKEESHVEPARFSGGFPVDVARHGYCVIVLEEIP